MDVQKKGKGESARVTDDVDDDYDDGTYYTRTKIKEHIGLFVCCCCFTASEHIA